MKEHLKREEGQFHRMEDLQAAQLLERISTLVEKEPDADRLMEDAALMVDDFKQGNEPNFDWVPDHLRVTAIAEWTEARNRVEQFKQSQLESMQEAAAEHKEERLSQEMQELAERSARLSELEAKFGEIPEEGKVSQRQIKTEIVKPETRSRFQKFFDSLAGKS